jgi:diaminohydroxyphosphoribosylaminopyrimidine deaminase/5-amino-6-(5-phosphoribosylamino)uracil reductase
MADFSARDTGFMTTALRLASRGATSARPNPVVGCVIVNAADEVVGQGWHQRAGEAHAEVAALAEACEKAAGATAYVTLEPCSHHGRTPPCVEQLIAARVSRVIYAVQDPNPSVAGQGAAALRAAGIKVESGLLSAAATEINRGFFNRMQRGRPWLRCKLAVSLDGRTALRNGVSQWITGAAARKDVHRWRALSGAILSGSGTVLGDNPSLTARSESGELDSQPLRVVLDSELRTPVDAKLFQSTGPILILHCRGSAESIAGLEASGASVRQIAQLNGRPDLHEVMRLLAEEQINDVWVEAGATLNGMLLHNGLVDELIVYQAASILGADAQGMFAIEPVETMQQRPEFELTDVRRIGADLRLRYKPGN